MKSKFKKISILLLSAVITLNSSAAFAAEETPADYIISNGDLYEMETFGNDNLNWHLFCTAGNLNNAEVKDGSGNHLYYRYQKSTEVFHSGNGSMWFDIEHLKQNAGTTGESIFGAVLWRKTENPFKHGKTYTISYWVKNETGAELIVFPQHLYYSYDNEADTSSTYAKLYYDGHATTGQNCRKTISADDGWQYVSHTFTANADIYKIPMCAQTRFYIVLHSTIGTIASGKGIYIDQLKFMEVPSGDLFPSSFTSATPENNADGIAVDSAVTFNFNGLVSADSISADDVYFNDDNTNAVTVTGTTNLDACTSTVTVQPVQPLEADTEYTVRIENLSDIFGRAYTGTTPTVSFTTMPDITYEYEFTDGNGDPITAIQEGEINYTYTATTHTDKVNDATVIMALCKNQTIVKFDLANAGGFTKFVPNPITASLIVELADGENINDYSVRCMIYDSIGTFRTVDGSVIVLD